MVVLVVVLVVVEAVCSSRLLVFHCQKYCGLCCQWLKEEVDMGMM